jgi:hypothetical protein
MVVEAINNLFVLVQNKVLSKEHVLCYVRIWTAGKLGTNLNVLVASLGRMVNSANTSQVKSFISFLINCEILREVKPSVKNVLYLQPLRVDEKKVKKIISSVKDTSKGQIIRECIDILKKEILPKFLPVKWDALTLKMLVGVYNKVDFKKYVVWFCHCHGNVIGNSFDTSWLKAFCSNTYVCLFDGSVIPAKGKSRLISKSDSFKKIKDKKFTGTDLDTLFEKNKETGESEVDVCF